VKKKRRKYTAEYKQEAVRLVRQSGRPVDHVAKDLGIPSSCLFAWLAATGDSMTETTSFAERDEIVRLRREVAELRMERDFLKKAAAFFAKESK